MKPHGAVQLEQMRFAGKRPPGFIVVTECRGIAKTARRRGFYPLVFTPGEAHDWRSLKGLRVRIITKLARAALASTCIDIVGADPGTFAVTYSDHRNSLEHEWVIDAAR